MTTRRQTQRCAAWTKETYYRGKETWQRHVWPQGDRRTVRGAERHRAHSCWCTSNSCSSAPAPCITRSCFEADGPGPAMISLQHSQRISAPERSAFACRTRAAPPRAAAPSSEGLARKDSAAQLQGLQSGARGGRNQSSTRSRQASGFAAEGSPRNSRGSCRRRGAARQGGARAAGKAGSRAWR